MSQLKLAEALSEFQAKHAIRGKGALAVVVHLTRTAKEKGLPLNPNDLITEGSGQVLGLGKSAVQKILADHGISKTLAEEGGRTSRGSLGIMQAYIDLLNKLNKQSALNLVQVEHWWIARVKDFFAAKPFRLRYDPAKSLQAVIQDLLAQAKKRQQESSGTMFQGAVLQHLVGAKLELALPQIRIVHNGSTVADAVSDRSGDFVIDDTVIHITTSPGEAVIRKCKSNIDAGCKPIILTVLEGVTVAKALANNEGLQGRIDIMDAEQFLAANLHELSLFKSSQRFQTLERLVAAYNKIVSAHETDPSLRIDLG